MQSPVGTRYRALREVTSEGVLMTKHKIAVIAGDGIGKEVVPEGIRVLEAAGRKFGFAFQWDELPWSCDYYVEARAA